MSSGSRPDPIPSSAPPTAFSCLVPGIRRHPSPAPAVRGQREERGKKVFHCVCACVCAPVCRAKREPKLCSYASLIPSGQRHPRLGAATLPVRALAMEERLGVAVHGRVRVFLPVPLLAFVERHEERCLFHGIEGLFVFPTSKIGLATLGPGYSETRLGVKPTGTWGHLLTRGVQNSGFQFCRNLREIARV